MINAMRVPWVTALASLILLGPTAAARPGPVWPKDESAVLAGRISSCRVSRDATVTIHRLSDQGGVPGEQNEVPLDEQGQFIVRVPQPGIYRVLVTEPGADPLSAVMPVTRLSVLPPIHSPGCLEDVPVPWKAATNPQLPALDEVLLTGRVFELSDERKPVAGAWVWASSPVARAVRTDDDGRYRMFYPRTVTFRLSVHAPGYRDIVTPARTDVESEVVRGPHFPLLPASYLRGRVVDSAGDPAMAVIEAAPAPAATRGTGADPPRALIAFTDGRGRFSLAVIPDSRYVLSVHGAESLEAEIDVKTAPAGETAPDLEVSLRARSSVTGRLSDPEEEPVHGATVVLLPVAAERDLLSILAGRQSSIDRYPSTVTGPTGWFRLQGLQAGRYRILATAPGFEPYGGPNVEISSGDRLDLGTIFLSAGAEIDGWVEDEEGRPIAAATIRVALTDRGGRSSAGRQSEPAYSDGRGRFHVRGLPHDQQVNLLVRKTGHLPTAVVAELPLADKLVVTLHPAGGVAGRVVDERGEPVSGARVLLRPATAGTSEVRRVGARGGVDTFAVTGDDGRFEIPDVEVGPATLSVDANLHLGTEIAVEVPAGETRGDVEVTLRGGATLEGRVLRADGGGVEGATVTAAGEASRSAGDGRFLLRGLPDRELEVVAKHPELGTTTGRAVSSRRRIDLVFDEPARLTILVSNAGERALAGAEVSITGGATPFPRFGSTDAGGSFRLRLEPGSYQGTVRKTGYRAAEIEAFDLAPGASETVRLRLSEGLTVSGAIKGAGNDPLQLARAEVLAVRPEGAASTGTVDLDGRYRISGLEPGSWRIVATLPDGRRAEGTVRLEDGGRSDVDLELGSGGELRGVIRLDGEPLAAAWITVSSFDGAVLSRTLTGHDGRFVVRGLEDERVQVDVSSAAGDLRVSVPARVGETVEVALRTGSLSGTVYGTGSGEAVAGASILLEPIADSTLLERRLRTGPDGRFGPVRLPEGNYRLSIDHPRHAARTLDVQVGGPDREITVPLDPI